MHVEERILYILMTELEIDPVKMACQINNLVEANFIKKYHLRKIIKESKNNNDAINTISDLSRRVR